MSTQRLLIIAAGTVSMMILMLLRRKTYPQVAVWKIPIISILLTLSGVAGAMLMFYIESGHFGGTSFFGALLFAPIFMLIALPFRISYRILMDLCAPAECIMLSWLKVDCLVSDCCIGRYLPTLGIQFPSQIVEMVTVILIMFVLLNIETRTNKQGKLYAYYLIFYSITRFILNWFRYGLTPFVWKLPAGNFWSLIAIAIGFIWLYIIKRTNDKLC